MTLLIALDSLIESGVLNAAIVAASAEWPSRSSRKACNLRTFVFSLVDMIGVPYSVDLRSSGVIKCRQCVATYARIAVVSS